MDTLNEVEPRDVATLFQSAQTFADELRKWDGEDLQHDVSADFFGKMLRQEDRAVLIFQGLTVSAGNDGRLKLSKADKVFATELADTIGPDYAQWFYHFSVLVTKLA